MSKEVEIALQPIRVGAIRLQIESLTKQCLVIEKIATEHHDGLDLGLDPELKNLLSFTAKLSEQVDLIVAAASDKDADSLNKAGEEIIHLTGLLPQLAASFKKGESAKARVRLSDSLEADGETALPEVNAVDAGVACFKAEVNQYSTLELQVQALCSLALEVAYNAASELNIVFSNTQKKE